MWVGGAQLEVGFNNCSNNYSNSPRKLFNLNGFPMDVKEAQNTVTRPIAPSTRLNGSGAATDINAICINDRGVGGRPGKRKSHV